MDGTNNNMLMPRQLLLVEYTHMIGVSFDFKAKHNLSEFQAWTAVVETKIRSIKTSAGFTLISEIGKRCGEKRNTFKSENTTANYASKHYCQLFFNTHHCN